MPQQTYHLGHNVGLIYGLPYGDGTAYPVKKQVIDEFAGYLSSKSKYRYLVAITADKYQHSGFPILSRNGFKKVVTFKSAHDCHDETITIWNKTNKGARKTSKEKIPYLPWNCSVVFHSGAGGRCNLWVEGPVKNAGVDCKRIGSTPIWFRVRPNYVVKEKVK